MEWAKLLYPGHTQGIMFMAEPMTVPNMNWFHEILLLTEWWQHLAGIQTERWMESTYHDNKKEQRVKDVCDLYINGLHKRNNQNWQPDIFHQICPFAGWNETPQASSHTGYEWQDAICRGMGGDSFDRHSWCAVSKHDTGTLNSKFQRDTNGDYDGRLHLVLCLLVDRTNMECVMVTCTDVYMDKKIIHIHGSTGKLSKQSNGTTDKILTLTSWYSIISYLQMVHLKVRWVHDNWGHATYFV